MSFESFYGVYCCRSLKNSDISIPISALPKNPDVVCPMDKASSNWLIPFALSCSFNIQTYAIIFYQRLYGGVDMSIK